MRYDHTRRDWLLILMHVLLHLRHGFPHRARPYSLNGKELLYALTLNPYVVLRPGGTMLAMGFVVDAVRNELAKHVPLSKPPDKDISIVFGPD